MRNITQLYINCNPGEWRLLPWISTLQPTEAGKREGYAKGWRFTFLCLGIERHRIISHDR